MQNDKWYVRCVDCLSIGMVLETPGTDWTCSICAGHIEVMGKVTVDGKRLEKDEEKCPCDRRCTHAVGPLCVCRCGCENHGTGRTVIVKRDVGPVPVVQMVDEDKALINALLWRENLQKAREMWKTAKERIEAYRKETGRYMVPYEMFYKPVAIQKGVEGAKEARTWKTRTKRMEAVLAITL